MTGGNKNVSINFEGRFTLTIDDRLVIGASVTLDEGTITVSPAPGDDDKFAYGTKITLTAVPDTGYGWKNWNGTGNDSINPATVNINSDKHVSVNFEERYLVMINNKVLKTAAIDITGGQRIPPIPPPARIPALPVTPSPCSPLYPRSATALTNGAAMYRIR